MFVWAEFGFFFSVIWRKCLDVDVDVDVGCFLRVGVEKRD